MYKYTVEGIRKVLFSTDPIGVIPENDEGFTKEFLDWANQNNQQIARKLEPPVKHRFFGADQIARGRLLGGCVEVLELLIGTSLWPSKED